MLAAAVLLLAMSLSGLGTSFDPALQTFLHWLPALALATAALLVPYRARIRAN